MSLVPPHWAEQTIALFVRDADWREAGSWPHFLE
jgi:hypothetical protein